MVKVGSERVNVSEAIDRQLLRNKNEDLGHQEKQGKASGNEE